MIAHCGPSGVLIIEVPLYRTAYCGPNGVLIVEVPLYLSTLYRTVDIRHSFRVNFRLFYEHPIPIMDNRTIWNSAAYLQLNSFTTNEYHYLRNY